MLVVAPVTMFLGVGTAIYLELYAKKGRLQALIQTNICELGRRSFHRIWNFRIDCFF